MKIRNGLLPLSSAGLLVLSLLLSAPAAADGLLFYEADEFIGEAEEIGVIGAARYRAVFVETAPLGEIGPDGELDAAPEVTLNLFEDTVVRVTLESAYPAVGEGWVWEGVLQSPHTGFAAIAFTDRTLAAEVEADGRIIQVRNDGEPLHLIRELSASDAALVRSAPNSQELDIYNRTNQERQSRGIYLLAWNNLLGNSARTHSTNMAVQGFFSHNNPYDGTSPGDRMTAAGYIWNSCAENIAGGQSSAAAAMTSWMNSSGHRANILNQVRCDLGVGYYYKAGSTWGYYWTQNFGRWHDVYVCPAVPTPGPGPTPPPSSSARAPLQLFAGDFDNDSFSEIAIFRRSTGLWSVRGVTRVYYGGSGDIPIPADFNGDGRSDIAIFRPTNGLWSVRGVTRFYYGRSGDYPIPMNYHAGYTVAGIFRPSAGLWSFRGGGQYYYGGSNDIPVIGPYNGRSGRWGAPWIAIFRPSTGLWSVRGLTRFYFGGSGDTPVPGAYTTGSSDPWRAAIFRPSNGLWAIRGVGNYYYGRSGDIPVPADYAGSWGDEIAIFRPSNGLWAIRGVGNYYYGGSADTPVTR